jgi:hypothetical protein
MYGHPADGGDGGCLFPLIHSSQASPDAKRILFGQFRDMLDHLG